MSSTFLLFLHLFYNYFQELTSIIIYCRLSVFTPHYKRTRIARNRAAVLNHYAHPRAVRDVCPLADYRAPDGGASQAAASGDEADFTCGMTAKEDKTAPCRVGRAAPGATALKRLHPTLGKVFLSIASSITNADASVKTPKRLKLCTFCHFSRL